MVYISVQIKPKILSLFGKCVKSSFRSTSYILAVAAANPPAVQVQKLAMEKEQVERDLEKTETAFSDLHAKYVKVKEVLENYKKNEATLKDALQKGQLAVNVSESRYAKLRAHAEEKIEEANKEIAGVRDQYASKITALEMKVKAQDREILSLKREVDIKVLVGQNIPLLHTITPSPNQPYV